MKTAGIIGGIGPESTMAYYRLLIGLYRERKPDGSYPQLIINSINMQTMRTLIESNDLPAVSEFLLSEIRKLSDAGADFGALSANTPHLVFDTLRQRSPIPLISIVEATCQAAKANGLKRLGLLGTRFTMQAQFFPDVFAQAGIAIVVPTLEEQDYIHEKYMHELLNGVFLDETREAMLRMVDRLKTEQRIDGLILGGTELPLLLGDFKHGSIPFLDTTRIHVEQIITRLLSS